jgi:Arc/MetJ-type ribon-helix-helix transcriptional regulator
MAQLVTRIDDELATAIDDLVTQGVYPNRSAAVRAALKELLRERRRQRDIELYRRFPQTEDELAGLAEETRAMIEEEPW